MSCWPKVDPQVRRRLLEEVRRRQNCDHGALSPAERIAVADRLLSFTRALGRPVAEAAASDEPAELWRRMKERFRRVDG